MQFSYPTSGAIYFSRHQEQNTLSHLRWGGTDMILYTFNSLALKRNPSRSQSTVPTMDIIYSISKLFALFADLFSN